jgi:hypothetical protein
MSETPDSTWLKADLLAHAEGIGITVDTSMTKAQILEAIESGETAETVTVEEVSEPEPVVEEEQDVWHVLINFNRKPSNMEKFGNLVSSGRVDKNTALFIYEGEKPVIPAGMKANIRNQ